ncbi:MAG: ParB N-terminal domain-containing protein [Rhodobacteraceae bacterium]|nr:ParB N-terminal domain-containing protein [Paracoccaceae bacterium]
MNMHTPLDATPRLVRLDLIYLHDMNPRQSGPDFDDEAMAQSIAINGLMQNLMGYADPAHPNRIGIVAGGRRLRALQYLKSQGDELLQSKQPDWDEIPVQVTDDPMLARSWAGAESATQIPLNPADEIRAYAAMADQGNGPDMIARAFAQTNRHVKGRLALASLIPEVLDALRAGHISLDVAKALTLARDGEEQLSVLTAARSGDWNAQRVRNALTKEQIRSDDRKVQFVGLVRYQAEGGAIETDLFEDHTYLHDSALIDRLFGEKLETEAEAMRAEQGWQWVKSTAEAWIPDSMTKGLTQIYRNRVELPEADQAEYDDLDERKWSRNDKLSDVEIDRYDELETRMDGDYTDDDRETGGIIVSVANTGKLVIGYACRERSESGTNSGSTTGATPSSKPALTQAGAEDLRRIGLMALQSGMIDKPDFLLDLFAWQMARGAASYSSPFAIVLTDQNIMPDAEGSWHMDPRLADPEPTKHDFNEDTPKTFAAFQALGKKHRNQVIAQGLTRSLQSPMGQMAALGKVMAEYAGVDIRKAWTPDAPTYFSRLSSPAMETLWTELLDAEADDERVVAFGKLKKGQKTKDLADLFANTAVQEALGLTRDQIATIDAWLPPELLAPRDA